jgi:predicted RNA-binding Zn ribbon-like protein
MISGDNPPKYCRWCGTRMPAPGMHEGSFKSETDCELEAVKSKLDEQVRLREMAESFLRTAIEINEKNTSRLDILATYLSDHHGLDAADVITLYQAKDVERPATKCAHNEATLIDSAGIERCYACGEAK